MKSKDPDDQPVSNNRSASVDDPEPHPLKRLIAELSSSSAAIRYRGHTIGSFWSDDEPRSPFEEDLTIGQLCTISVGVLLQKRSFTEKKQRALANAIKRCLASDGGESTSVSERNTQNHTTAALKGGEIKTGDENTSLHSIQTKFSTLHPLAGPTLSRFFEYADRNSSILRRVASLFSECCEIKSLEAFLLTRYLTESQVANLTHRSTEDIQKSIFEITAKGKTLCSRDPFLSFPCHLLSSQLGICPDYLMKLCQNEELGDYSAAELSFMLLCNGGGLCSFESDLPAFRGLLTTKSERLSHLLDHFIETLPQPTSFILDWVDNHFPLLSDRRRQDILFSLQCKKINAPTPKGNRKRKEGGRKKPNKSNTL